MNSIRNTSIVLVILIVTLVLVANNNESAGTYFIAGALFFALLAVNLKKFANFFLPVIFTLIGLAIFEYGLILLRPSAHATPIYDPDSTYSKGYWRDIQDFGYRANPGVYTSRKTTSDGEEIYDVVYTIGEDGYRNTANPDKSNIYLYGGSFAFGEGLNDNETLSHYLWENYSLPVKNVGFHGFGLHQALFNIENGISAENGVNILLTAPFHSLRSACKPGFSIGTPRYVVADGYAELSGFCPEDTAFMKILKYSNIFNMVNRLVDNWDIIRDEDVELYLSIVRSIQRYTNENNSKLIIAFIRATDEELSNTSWTNESIMLELDKISDYLVDVTLSESPENLERKYYIHRDDKHPSALANSERARLIAPVLQGLSIVQP